MRILIDSLLIALVLLIAESSQAQVFNDFDQGQENLIFNEIQLMEIENETDQLNIELSQLNLSLLAMIEQRSVGLEAIENCNCSRERYSQLISELETLELDIETVSQDIAEIEDELVLLNELREQLLEEQ